MCHRLRETITITPVLLTNPNEGRHGNADERLHLYCSGRFSVEKDCSLGLKTWHLLSFNVFHEFKLSFDWLMMCLCESNCLLYLSLKSSMERGMYYVHLLSFKADLYLKQKVRNEFAGRTDTFFYGRVYNKQRNKQSVFHSAPLSCISESLGIVFVCMHVFTHGLPSGSTVCRGSMLRERFTCTSSEM